MKAGGREVAIVVSWLLIQYDGDVDIEKITHFPVTFQQESLLSNLYYTIWLI